MNQKAIDRMVAENRLRRLAKAPFDQVDHLLAASLKDLQNNRKFLEIDEAKAYDTAYEGDVLIGRAEAEAAIEEAGKFRAAVVKIIDGWRPPS